MALNYDDLPDAPSGINYDDLPGPGLLDYATEVGKAVVRGVGGPVVANLQALGAGGPQAALQRTQRIEQLLTEEPPGPDAPPEERAAYRVRRGQYHPSREQLHEELGRTALAAAQPVAQTPMYRAGESLAEALPQSRQILNPVVEDVAAGVGSVGANIATGFIPFLGPAAMTLGAFGQGAGEAASRAVRSGAEEAEIARASGLGNLAGATELVDNLLPMLGSTGKVLGFIRRVSLRTLQGVLAEGGQEGLQQFVQNAIAKGVYKPEQELGEDVPYNMLIGGLVGGPVTAALGGRGDRTVPQTAPNVEQNQQFIDSLSTVPQSREEALARAGVSTEGRGGAVQQPVVQQSPVAPSAPAPSTQQPAATQPTMEPPLQPDPAQPQPAQPQPVVPLMVVPPPDTQTIADLEAERALAAQRHREAIFSGDQTARSAAATRLQELNGAVLRARGLMDESLTPMRPEELGPVFYSAVLDTVQKKVPTVASAAQIMATIRQAPGVKQEEIDLLGLPEYLKDGNGRVSKEDLITHIEEQRIWVTERMLDTLRGEGWDDLPRYTTYTTPGGRRQRELLLTVPQESTEPQRSGEAKPVRGFPRYNEPHWGAVPNIVAHVRFDEREDIDGHRSVHVHEFQSSIHEKARSRGYREEGAPEFSREEAERADEVASQARMAFLNASEEERFPYPYSLIDALIRGETDDVIASYRASPRILQLAREAREAVDRSDTVQRSRMALPRLPFRTSWAELTFKRMLRWAVDNGYSRITWNTGELARTYAAGGPTSNRVVEGLRDFYDREVPKIAKKWAKKIGGSVGTTKIAVDGEAVPVGFIDIPDAARAYISAGLPMFNLNIPEGRKVTQEVMDNITKQHPLYSDVPAMIDALREVASQFGIDKKVSIFIQEKINHPSSRSPNGPNGVAWQLPNGNYNIEIAMSRFSNRTELWTTIMHEFGHVVMWEKFNALPINEKATIYAAYQRFVEDFLATDRSMLELLSRRKAITDRQFTVASPQTLASRHFSEFPLDLQNYYAGFAEWFADQVARWAVTSEEPLSMVEKVFARLGRAVRDFMKLVSGKVGLRFLPAMEMKLWLDSFVVNDAEIAWKNLVEMNFRTLKLNRQVFDVEIPVTEQFPELLGARSAMSMMFGGSPPPAVQQAAAHADRMRWWQHWTHGLDQIADRNPRFTPVTQYREIAAAIHRLEAQFHDAAVRIGKDGRTLGVEELDRVFGFIDEMTRMTYLSPQEISQGIVRHPSVQEAQRLVQKYGLSVEGQNLYRKYNAMINGDGTQPGFIDHIAAVAKERALRQGQSPAALRAIDAQLQELKRRPYFPFMHFGNHYTFMRDPAGNIVHFRTFERRGIFSAQAQQKRHTAQLRREFQRQYGRAPTATDVAGGILPENAGTLVGLPPTLLRLMQNTLMLSPEQINAAQILSQAHTAGLTAVLHPRAQRKFFVPGYSVYTPGHSLDMQRAFAKYMFHGAKFLAKVKYVDQLRDLVHQAENIPDNTANKIAHFMQNHFEKVVLDSRGDFGMFRGAIFLWTMGYVVSAATQNLSQVPMIVFPYLTAKFGPLSTPILLRTLSQVNSFYRRGHYDNQTDFELRAISYGIKTGRISETQASDLAGMSQGGNLIVGIGGNKFQRGAIHVLEKAAWFFEMAEQLNRRLTYRTALKLAMLKPRAKIIDEAVAAFGLEFQELRSSGHSDAEARAIITANYVTEQTNYNYSRIMRPRFMRGVLGGTLTVFMKYMQSTLALIGNNKSDFLPLYLMTSLAIGGLMGLPGAEDLRDLIRALAQRLFSKDYDVEKEARKYVLELLGDEKGSNADLVLHGFARRGMGIAALLDLAGSFATGKPSRGLAAPMYKDDPSGGPPQFSGAQNVPFPVLSRERALGMGHILPFSPGKLMQVNADSNKVLMEQTQKASGAVFSVGFNIYKTMFDQHLGWDDMKRYERAVPRLLGSASQSFRAFTEGRERSKGGPAAGSTITQYDIRDTEQMMEALAIGLGYQTLREQAKWDQIMAQREAEAFIKSQRNALLEQMFEAVRGHNEGERDKVRQKIIQFNTELPEWGKGMALSSDSVQQSMLARSRGVVSREAGVPLQRGAVPIAREIQRLYPEAQVDVRPVR